MKAPDQSGLVERAMQLRSQNPDAWNALLAEMQRYTNEITRMMVSSPPELLLRAQGMALGCSELTTILIEAPKTYEAMYAARQRQKG